MEHSDAYVLYPKIQIPTYANFVSSNREDTMMDEEKVVVFR